MRFSCAMWKNMDKDEEEEEDKKNVKKFQITYPSTFVLIVDACRNESVDCKNGEEKKCVNQNRTIDKLHESVRNGPVRHSIPLIFTQHLIFGAKYEEK